MAWEPAAPIHRTVQDGVPLHWTPSPPPGTGPGCVGTLLFRAGIADETVNTRGISHLVEHLVLYPFGPNPSHFVNGSTEPLRTGFHVAGTPDEVATFMRRVCEGITKLPLDRLQAESRVLRTEAASRQLSLEAYLLHLRYGARGMGLVRIPEFGLEAPDHAAVSAWAAAHFTRANASAWIWGPLPTDLSFDPLPEGERRPCPQLQPLADVRTPAVVGGGPGGIGMSFAVPRQSWIQVPIWIARKRLIERLRYDKGLAYEVEAFVTLLSSHWRHAQISTGCLTEHAGAVQYALFDVLDAMATEGPYLDELEEFSKEAEVVTARPENLGSELDRMAWNELIGYTEVTPAVLASEFAQKTRSQWAESMRTALDSMILVLPPGIEPMKDRLTLYPSWSTRMVRGRRFRASAQRLPWPRKHPELVVGTEGVSVVMPQGHGITVHYANCAGAVLHRNGTLDLFGDDGFTIHIAAAEWHDGDIARATVLKTLPGDRVLVVRDA